MDVSINWLAVLLAAISTFVIGGLWYSLLFARAWQHAAGVTDEQLKTGAARIFIGSFLLALVMATSLALFYINGSYAVVAFTTMGAITGALQ